MRALGFRNLIIGITGNSMEDELRSFLHSGADLVLTKPMRAQTLEHILALISSEGCQSKPGLKLHLFEDSIAWQNSSSNSSSVNAAESPLPNQSNTMTYE
jgi:hypothetical protein